MNRTVTGSLAGGEVESEAPAVGDWQAALEKVGERLRRCFRRRASRERALG